LPQKNAAPKEAALPCEDLLELVGQFMKKPTI
jgi:hypothetical protein